MNGNSAFFNLLTMCRRSGRMSMGFDPAKDSLASKKAKVILIASDISAKTEKEIRFFSEKSGVPVVRTAAAIEEYGFALGKKVGIVSVEDDGFAGKLIKLSEQMNEGNESAK